MLLSVAVAHCLGMKMRRELWCSPSAGKSVCGYCWSGGLCSSGSLEMLESLDLAECTDSLDPAGLVWLKWCDAESASWHSRQYTI